MTNVWSGTATVTEVRLRTHRERTASTDVVLTLGSTIEAEGTSAAGTVRFEIDCDSTEIRVGDTVEFQMRTVQA